MLHCKWVHMQPKALISTEAKKLFIKNPLSYLNDIQYIYRVFSQLRLTLSLGHLFVPQGETNIF